MNKNYPSMLHKYTGKSNIKRLLNAFREQTLVAGNETIAKCLAKKAVIVKLHPQQEFITQGNSDDDIFFILSGSVSVIVNKREIAVRQAGEHVGEMALIDTSALRSASNCAREQSIVAKIKERDFSHIADQHPELWRKIAVTIAKRMRERNKFHTMPRSEPVVFIGSSSEGIKIAEVIKKYLSRRPVVPKLWSDGVFECSKTAIEDLTRIIKEIDFAIIIFTADDITKSRGKLKPSPRDNVIFELGLLMGAISRKRTYIVAPKDVNIKIPTDLLGITCLHYTTHRNKCLNKRLRTVLKTLYRQIQKYGPI